MIRTRTGYLDSEPFIAAMERAQQEGNLVFVHANMPRLEWLIVKYQERVYELAQLQCRARMVRGKHEPSSP